MFRTFIVLASLFISGIATAQDFSIQYERNVESIVNVEVQTPEGDSGMGTGWFIADRFIVTAAHVLSDNPFNSYVEISGNDQPNIKTPVKVIYSDRESDVGLLEVTTDKWQDFKIMEKPINLRLSSLNVRPGQQAWGIGNRQGNLFQFYGAYVSMPNQPDMQYYMNIHVIDTEIFQGDSGGPLFDHNGFVIGLARSYINPGYINVMKQQRAEELDQAPNKDEPKAKPRPKKDHRGAAPVSDNMEFFVSSAVIRKSIKDFVDHRKSPFAPARWKNIDIEVDELDGASYIAKVADFDTFFKSIGLKEGDRRLVINGIPVREYYDVRRILSMVAYQDLVRIEWERGGEKMFGEAIYSD